MSIYKNQASIIEETLLKAKGVKSISGKGLMVGVELDENIKAIDVCNKCIENGLIPLTAKTKIRLLPPLNITEKELKAGLDILVNSIKECM